MTDSASARCTRRALSSAMAPGSSAARSAASVAGGELRLPGRGRAVERRRARPTVRPRHSSGNPIDRRARLASCPARRGDPRPGWRPRRPRRSASPTRPPPAPRSLERRRQRRAPPASAPGPRRRRRAPASTAPAATRTPACTSASATRSGSRLELTARIISASTSARASWRRSAVCSGRSLLGEVRTERRHAGPARATTGASLPSSSRSLDSASLWNGGSF